MVSKARFSILQNGIERHLQIESPLSFFQTRFLYKSKHTLFEGGRRIGFISSRNGGLVYRGVVPFSNDELSILFDFISTCESTLNQSLPPSFGFGIELNNNLSYCEVLIKDGLYDIWFDGKIAARLSLDGSCHWVQLMGANLKKEVVKTITDRVEAHFSKLLK